MKEAPLPTTSEQVEASLFVQKIFDANMQVLNVSFPRICDTVEPVTFMKGTKVWLLDRAFVGQFPLALWNDKYRLLHTEDIITESVGCSWWVSKCGSWCPRRRNSLVGGV